MGNYPVKFNRGKQRAVIAAGGEGINSDTIYFATDGGIFVGSNQKAVGSVQASDSHLKVKVDGADVAIAADGADVKLSSDYTIASTYVAPAVDDSLDVAVGKLAKGIADAAESGVTSFGGQTGAITIDGTGAADGGVKFEMNGKQLKGSVNGLDAYAKKADEISNAGLATKGVKVDLSGTVAEPVATVTVNPGTIESGNGSVVTGGAVYDAIDGAIKDLDKADAAIAGQVVKAVSEADGIITVTRAALAATDIKLEKLATPSETTLAAEYKLVNGEGATLGDTIKIAKDQFLKEVHFYAKASDVPDGVTVPAGTEFPVIRFIFTTAAGDTESWVSVKDLVDVYTAGEGIDVTGNVISAKIASGSKLSRSAAGLDVDTAAWNVTGVNNAASAGVSVVLDGANVKASVSTGDVAADETKVVTGGAVHDAIEAIEVTASGDSYVSASATGKAITVAATASTKASLALADSSFQKDHVVSSFQATTDDDHVASEKLVKTELDKKQNTITVTGGAAETDKYVDSVTKSGDTITVTKKALPSGTGTATATDWKNPITSVSLSGHTLSGANAYAIPAATSAADGYMTKAQAQNLDTCVAALTWEEA